MTSAIAILTYRRLPVLAKMFEGLLAHCKDYPIAVFEDFGRTDGTARWLAGDAKPESREDLLATYCRMPWGEAFLGTENLGVASNSNRALRWFEEGGWDHLCLCNDDLEVLGDFPAFYAKAHQELGINFFCFNDFWEWPTHRWALCRSRGYRLRIFRQMTGIMCSVTRKAFNEVGYFDARFGKFGQEHCDWTNRFRFTGNIRLDGVDQPCVDVEPTNPDGSAGQAVLKHQECPTCVIGDERARADQEALEALREVAKGYNTESNYKPFALRSPRFVGGFLNQGIPTEQLKGYRTVTCS